MRFDWIVVGAGLTGATIAERIASELDQKVLVVERRGHVAGNAFDEIDGAGIRVHRYGAHIFHTSSDTVWTYLSRFTAWRPYEHRVRASVDGRLIPLPFNLTSLNLLLPPRTARRMSDRLVSSVGDGGRVAVLTLLEHPDPLLRELGCLVNESIFLNYTRKQWGLTPEQVDRSVTARVPVVASRDDRYFDDRYQAIPKHGYTAMVKRMLAHDNISLLLDTDFRDLAVDPGRARIVYTGAIDEYLGYRFGPLAYRSLRFSHEVVPTDRVQPVAVVNYPNEHDYTRMIEHAFFSGQHLGVTTVTREFPVDHLPGENERYYPVPGAVNRAAYERYRAVVAEERPTILAGRLARYRYLDMDEAVGLALAVFRHEVAAPAKAEGVAL